MFRRAFVQVYRCKGNTTELSTNLSFDVLKFGTKLGSAAEVGVISGSFCVCRVTISELAINSP